MEYMYQHQIQMSLSYGKYALPVNHPTCHLFWAEGSWGLLVHIDFSSHLPDGIGSFWEPFYNGLWTHNPNLEKKYSVMKNNDLIMSQFCTSHHSHTVMAGDNLWHDWIIGEKWYEFPQDSIHELIYILWNGWMAHTIDF